MEFLITAGAVWLFVAIAGLFLADSGPKGKWEHALSMYKEEPSDRNKKYLAKCAEAYVKERKFIHHVLLWPITLSVIIVVALVKAPKRIYYHFKNHEGDYAQAKMHMNGEIK